MPNQLGSARPSSGMYVATAPSSARRWRSWARARTRGQRRRTEVQRRGSGAGSQPARRAGPAVVPAARRDRLARVDRHGRSWGSTGRSVVDRTTHRTSTSRRAGAHEPRHATLDPTRPAEASDRSASGASPNRNAAVTGADRGGPVAVDWTSDELTTLAAIADDVRARTRRRAARIADGGGPGDGRRSRPGPGPAPRLAGAAHRRPPTRSSAPAGARSSAMDQAGASGPCGRGASRGSPQRRSAFHALRKLATFLAYAVPDGPDGPGTPNPRFAAIGYQPERPPLRRGADGDRAARAALRRRGRSTRR